MYPIVSATFSIWILGCTIHARAPCPRLSMSRAFEYPASQELARLFITFKEKQTQSVRAPYVCTCVCDVYLQPYLRFPDRQLSAAFFWHNRMKARAAVMQFESARLTLRIAPRVRGTLRRSVPLGPVLLLNAVLNDEKNE